MELDAFLADSAVVAEGKLYVQGAGWNVINVMSIPATHDRIGLGLLFRVPYTATNQEHRFEIVLHDADGNEAPLADTPPGGEGVDGKIQKIGGAFNVGRPPTLPHGDEQVVPLALNINGLTFASAGLYSIIVTVDGTELKRLTFRVQQPPQIGPIG